MRGLLARTTAIGALFAILTATFVLAGTAQTPESSTPEPASSYEITVLGVTGVEPASLATPAGTGEEGDRTIHALLSLTIEPGAPVPALTGMRSVVAHTQQGSLVVTPGDGVASVSVGTGGPILSGDDGGVVCERQSCQLESGQAVVLEPGNGFSIMGGSFQMEASGDDVTVVHLSLLLPASALGERCWICPRVTT